MDNMIDVSDINSWLILARWYLVMSLAQEREVTFPKPNSCYKWSQFHAIYKLSKQADTAPILFEPLKHNVKHGTVI